MKDKRNAGEDYSCWKIGGMIVQLEFIGDKKICERSEICKVNDCEFGK